MPVVTKVILVNGVETICKVTTDNALNATATFYRALTSQQVTIKMTSGEVQAILRRDDGAEGMASHDVTVLTHHLQPQLDVLFSPSPPTNTTSPPPRVFAPHPPVAGTLSDGTRVAGMDAGRQLQASKVLLRGGDYGAAASSLKQTITLIRKQQRTQKHQHQKEEEDGSVAVLLPETYFLLGLCFSALQKPSRAEACFLLTSKTSRPPLSLSLSPSFASRAREELLKLAEDRLCHHSSAKQASEPPTSASSVVRAAAVRDVEDLLATHSLHAPAATEARSDSASASSLFHFSCTMCGECCRSSDNVLLSPHDVFLLTRSPGLGLYGISTTTQLLAHPCFQGVFHYSQRGGVAPLCSLRPAQQRDSSGHCFFAFPLYSRPIAPSSAGGSLPSPSKKALFAVTTEEEEVDERPPRASAQPLELVPFADYFAGAKIGEPTREGVESEQGKEAELDLREREEEEEGEEQDREQEMEGRTLPQSWQAVSNSFGRQGLGCLLGEKSMPTMCRTYPVAPELSQVDFWHVRSSFWRKGRGGAEQGGGAGGGGGGGGDRPPAPRPAPAWQVEEHYVAAKTASCEGFVLAGDREVASLPRITPVKGGKYLNPRPAGEQEQEQEQASAGGVSVQEFLGPDTLDRMEETQWLLALVRDIRAYFKCSAPPSSSSSSSTSTSEPAADLFAAHPLGRSVRLLYMNRLAQVWYNFDSLQCFRSRPVKSYRRLKSDLEALTWVLVRETARFLQALAGAGVSGDRDSVCAQYTELLVRLNVM